MRTLLAPAAAALAALTACSFDPPGRCGSNADCSVGTQCTTGVCSACAGGICDVTRAIADAGDSISIFTTPFSSASTLTATFTPHSIADGTKVTLGWLALGTVPLPIAGAVEVAAFRLEAPGITNFNSSVRISGTHATTLPPSTVVNLARLDNGAWTDVVTALTGRDGALRTMRSSSRLPGVRGPGSYLIYLPPPGTSTTAVDFGLALIPDDGQGLIPGLQLVTLFDDNGAPLAVPTNSNLGLAAGDLDGAAITPDGSQGVMVDGSNYVVFFSDLQSGRPYVTATRIDITDFGGDGDAIAVFPNGDEVVVSGDGQKLVVISGIASGAPVLAEAIPVPGSRDGLALSNDGRSMLARGGSGLTVFAVDPVPSTVGSLGGKLTHAFTQVANLAIIDSFGEDGRDGMAISPVDSSRGVVVGRGAFESSLQLLTNLRTIPKLGQPFPISGTSVGYAVSITPDGTRAIVGTDAGIAVIGGIDTGALVLVGALYDPSYVGADKASYKLSAGGVPTLGISLDANYVVALTPNASTNGGLGTLLTIPLLPTGLGPPVGQLNGVAVPGNDQLLMH